MAIERRRLLTAAAAITPLALLSASSDRSRAAAPPTPPTGPATDLLAISVLDHGAVGDGQTDDTVAVRAAVQAVLDSRRDDGQVTRILSFPAGIYRVTQADALLGTPAGGKDGQVRGFTIQGIGKRSTEIFFDLDAHDSDNPRDNNLMTAANRLRGLRVSGLSFRSANARLSWLYCWSSADSDAATTTTYPSGANQDFVLDDVEWRGPWNRVIGLDGDEQSNLNSEWAFYNCHASNTASFDDAFLHSGMTPRFQQQDQFLNFWFYACKFEYAAGTLLRLDKGGFVTVNGGSWIAGIDDNRPATLFSMPPGDHLASVQGLIVTGTRFELRHPTAQLMDCAWSGPTAHITFQNISDGSQSFRDWAGDATTVRLRPANGALPTVKFLNSELMGHHLVQQAKTGGGRVVYDGCSFSNAPQGGVGADQFLRYEGSPPSYRFVDCYGAPDAAG